MHICNYCKRVLKEDYETCPGCGSSDFSNKSFLGEIVIKEVPKGGYKPNLNEYKKRSYFSSFLILLSLLFYFFLQYYFYPLIFSPLLAGLVFIIPSIIYKYKIQKKINKIKRLSKIGILVKAIPYNIVKIKRDYSNNNVPKCIEVIYDNSAGIGIPLYSDVKYDIDEKYRKYKTVDLLIDPNDYSNYYIDYEIY